MLFEPIGYFRCPAHFPQQAPRQGVVNGAFQGRVELAQGQNFEMALRDLDGFERIWLLYGFHQVDGWRPTARPPVPPQHGDRVGVFASRSPYRPNPIGMTAVRLLGVNGRTLDVDDADLLDGSPIFDIKPYIPEFDAFPLSRPGWLDGRDASPWSIRVAEHVAKEASWIVAHGGPDLVACAFAQLSYNPFDGSRKRVTLDAARQEGVLSFRTWRVGFHVDEDKHSIELIHVMSGYAPEELLQSDDPYGDKTLHRSWSQDRRAS